MLCALSLIVRLAVIVLLPSVAQAGDVTAETLTRGYGFPAIEYFTRLREQKGTAGSQEDSRDDPVMTFLTNPTLESGRRYIQWNEERIEKILQAQLLLDKLSSAGGSGGSSGKGAGSGRNQEK